MRSIEIRRYRGLGDDVVGGVLTFLLEVAVVLGLGAATLGVAAILSALT